MNADIVWQWSMRLWFLIIAWKEAEGCRRGAQKGGYFTGNQQVPQSGFTFEPVGMTSCFFPWWLISSHHNTPSNPPLAYVNKTHACCYGDSGASWQDGEDVFFFVGIQKRFRGMCHQPTGSEPPRDRLMFKLRWSRESTFLWTEKEADHSSGHETWDFGLYQIKGTEISTSDTHMLWVSPFFTQYSLKACLGLRVDSRTVQVNIHVNTSRQRRVGFALLVSGLGVSSVLFLLFFRHDRDSCGLNAWINHPEQLKHSLCVIA